MIGHISPHVGSDTLMDTGAFGLTGMRRSLPVPPVFLEPEEVARVSLPNDVWAQGAAFASCLGPCAWLFEADDPGMSLSGASSFGASSCDCERTVHRRRARGRHSQALVTGTNTMRARLAQPRSYRPSHLR
jgi:hypothetical protein